MGVAGGQVRVPGVRALGHGAVLVGTCEQIWKYDDRRNLGTPPNTQPCTPYLRGLFKPALPSSVALGATLWPPMSFCRKQRPFCRKASPRQVGIPARPPAWCPQWEFSSICLSLHLVGQLAPTPWHSLRARLHRGPQLPALTSLTLHLLHSRTAGLRGAGEGPQPPTGHGPGNRLQVSSPRKVCFQPG